MQERNCSAVGQSCGGCSIHWCKSRTDLPNSSVASASEIMFSARAREQRRSEREGRFGSNLLGLRIWRRAPAKPGHVPKQPPEQLAIDDSESGSDTGSHALLNRAHASSCTAPLVTDGRTASADYCTDGIAEHQERSSTAAQPRTASRGLRRGALGILPSLEYHETGTKGDAPPDGMCATQ